MTDVPKGRKMTPKGQMAMSAAGPAISLLPPVVKSLFGPGPPIKFFKKERVRTAKVSDYTGLTATLSTLQSSPEGFDTVPEQVLKQKEIEASTVPVLRGKDLRVQKQKDYLSSILPAAKDLYLSTHSLKFLEETEKASGDEALTTFLGADPILQGMNPLNTLFIGRLDYSLDEGDLLEAFERFGTVKDVKVVRVTTPTDVGDGTTDRLSLKRRKGVGAEEGDSRGYAFLEFAEPDALLQAYKVMDGKKLTSATTSAAVTEAAAKGVATSLKIVVDVQRSHTVKGYLPRSLGGGIGATRRGGKGKNMSYPGRLDVRSVGGLHGGPQAGGPQAGGPMPGNVVLRGDR